MSISVLWFADALNLLILGAVLSIWRQAANVAGTLIGKQTPWQSFIFIIALQGSSRILLGLSEYLDRFAPMRVHIGNIQIQGMLELCALVLSVLSIVLSYKVFGNLWADKIPPQHVDKVRLAIAIGISVMGVWVVPSVALLNAWTGAFGLGAAALSLLKLGLNGNIKTVIRVSGVSAVGCILILITAITQQWAFAVVGSTLICTMALIGVHVRVREIFKHKVMTIKAGHAMMVYVLSCLVLFGLSAVGDYLVVQESVNDYAPVSDYALLSMELIGLMSALVIFGSYFRKLTVVVTQYVESVSEQRTSGLLNGINVAAFLCAKKDDGIVQCSLAAQALTGQLSADLVGKNVWNLLGCEPVQEHAERTLKDGRVLQLTTTSLQVAAEPMWVITAVDVTGQKKAEHALELLANYDPLTLLPNRRQVLEHLTHLGSMGTAHTVLFLDLDNFKAVNDTRGHHSGDAILKECAQVFDRCAKNVGAWVGRLGGDEFVVIVPSNKPQHYEAVSGALIEQLKASWVGSQGVGVSVGCARYPQDGPTVEDVLRRADAALYESKRLGGARLSVFDQSMEERLMRELFVEQFLREALDKVKQIQSGKWDCEQALPLYLQLQPVVDGNAKCAYKAEALLRADPQYGISVLELIKVAEQGSMMAPLGHFVLEHAVCVSKALHAKGHPVCISVNVSAKQFEDDTFWQRIEQLSKQCDLRALISLEMTETALSVDLQKSRACLLRAKACGLQIALDDFGAGYSSLAQLKNMPIDVVKLDKSLIDGIEDPMGVKVLSASIAMGQALGLQIVCEGVEKPCQSEWLQQQAVDGLQGYYFSRPLDVDQFEQWMVNQA